MTKIFIAGLVALAGVAYSLPGQSNSSNVDQRVELGAITWSRNLEKAKALSAKTGKPLFVQFQEVPG